MTKTDCWWDLTIQISTGNQVKKVDLLKKANDPFLLPKKKKNPLNIIITSGMETYPKNCKKYFHKEPILCLLQMQDVQPSGSEKDYASL